MDTPSIDQPTTPRLTVEIWSDVVCPWCFIGKRRFERALAGFEHADEVEVRWRSFQLDPNAPRFDPDKPFLEHAEYLGNKFGGGRAQGLQMIQQVSQIAAGEGLAYDLEHAQGGNTGDAHRILHAALDHGGPALQGAVKERLLRGYFTERANISDPAVLADLAAQAGLPRERAEAVLAGDEYADEVARDQGLAQSFGANGVPFFVIDRRFGVSGAQQTAVFERALRQAWDEAGASVAD